MNYDHMICPLERLDNKHTYFNKHKRTQGTDNGIPSANAGGNQMATQHLIGLS